MVDQPILQRTLLVDGNYFNVRANVFENRKIAIWDSVDDGVDVDANIHSLKPFNRIREFQKWKIPPMKVSSHSRRRASH